MRRQGRPRKKWIDITLQEAWNFMKEENPLLLQFDGNGEQRLKLQNAALKYERPFHTKPAVARD